MKKFFQFGLLLLFIIALQVMVPHKAGPSYQDTSIQCYTMPDQVSVDLLSFNTDAFAAGAGYQIIRGDVEESSFNLLSNPITRQNDIMEIFCNIDNPVMSTNALKQPDGTSRIEGLFRLDIGELYRCNRCEKNI